MTDTVTLPLDQPNVFVLLLLFKKFVLTNIISGCPRDGCTDKSCAFFSGLLFKGTDGYKISTTASIGRLEIFAWRTDTLPPLIEKTTQLGPNIANETFEMSLVAAGSEMFVQAWVSFAKYTSF